MFENQFSFVVFAFNHQHPPPQKALLAFELYAYFLGGKFAWISWMTKISQLTNLVIISQLTVVISVHSVLSVK